ncbi:MAG TPA: prepilin-type N-terminal cleavage/methylation domain-containing protein [Chthoniobacter sp.]|jgi:prepilin-type N-terminal cleavage/methylation domain-containing protein
MNSSLRPQPRSASAGFTLVELLTVIAIIAILMGLLFPAINIAREQARKTQAKTDCAQITAAVKAYYSEYGKYPLPTTVTTQGNPQDIIFGQSQGSSVGSGFSNQQLFDILRNIDSTGATPPGQPNQYNPRAIVFFDGKTATDPTNPRGGFVPSNATGSGLQGGAYMDPWGTEYFISVDADYNNQLTNLPYTDFQSTNAPYTGVGIFSLGKDQKLGTNGDGYYKNQSTNLPSDDIISWQ